MLKKFNFGLIIILILAFALRYKDYASFPVYGETQDEVAWTWLGTGLLQGNPPTTWSGTNVTGYVIDYDRFFGETKYRIVSPYLDNPYLFSLVPGFFALIKGFNSIEIPSLAVIRFPMLLIGVVNVWLLSLLVRKLFRPSLGLLAGILYATIPTAVFSSRVVVAENALITIMLTGLIYVSYHPKLSARQAIGLGILCGLGILMKVAGLVIPAALWLYFYWQKQTRIGWIILGTALLLGSVYPLYGLLTAPQLFMAVMAKQMNLSIGLSGLFHFFIYPQLVQKTLMDGWMYLGLGSLIYYTVSHGENRLDLVSAMIFGWLGFLLTATPEVVSHGWYAYPLIPLMIIGLVKAIDSLKARIGLFPIFSIFVILPLVRLLLLDLNWSVSRLFVKVLFVLVFVPLLLKIPASHIKYLNLSLMILAIILNCLVIYHFNRVVYWEDSLHFYPIRSGE